MTIEAQAENFNQDGSISIKVGTDTVKYVKESDLGAVKVQLKDKETEVSTLQTNLADATTKYDKEHQSLLQVRTASEQFEKDAKEGATHKTRVGELETEVTGLKTGGEASATKLTDFLRSFLTLNYKIDAEKIKGMTLADLETTEKTLRLTGAVPTPANYDGKGGGVSSPDELKGKSPLALATMGYEQTKK